MQSIRKAVESKEKIYLSDGAAVASATAGRLHPDEICDIRTAFQHDRDRIIHSKAFRRLMHKTQVFISPSGDHYRTRITHTLEVSQIARTIAKALCLNEDLTEAIALGHDLGHTPFGHSGEAALDKVLRKFGMRFYHNEQSLHVIDNIEKLNLTMEVRDGILNHPWRMPLAMTMEGQIVRFADRIAYINHDIDDAVRSKLLKKNSIPKELRDFIGKSTIDVFVRDLINNSMGKSRISMSKKALKMLMGLYTFMFKNVYRCEEARKQDMKIEHIISALFDYYFSNPKNIPGFTTKTDDRVLACIVRDFISGMTDRYAVNTFTSIFVPSEWNL